MRCLGSITPIVCAGLLTLLSLAAGVAAAAGAEAVLLAGTTVFGGLVCVILWIVWFIIWIMVAIWVYRDAESRGTSGPLWLIVVILLGIIGVIIYLVVRPGQQMPPAGYAPPPGYQQPPPGYAPPPQYLQSQYPPPPPTQQPPQAPPPQ